MKYLIFLFIFFSVSLLAADTLSEKQLDIMKGLDVYGNAIKSILNYYMEDVPMDTLVKTGIEGMLSNLDPYSEYFLSVENNEISAIANGKYFGFGFTFRVIHNKVVLTRIKDNSPAKIAGFKVGDIIYSIDTVVLDAVKDIDKVFMRASNKANFKIIREGTKDTLTMDISKDTIEVDAVTYSSILNKDIGYIRLERFTINSYSEFQRAFYNLQKQRILNGLIIDLRGNGGGIMQEALKICNMFVPAGSLLLTTKGKNYNREYKTQTKPIDTLLPLVILIDESSASASEIVAGCMQDLDRATIMGNTSFGKGLVQEVFPLSNSYYLKLTTAKYYTPSGRCIQKINYFNNDDKIDNNSSKIFHTNKGKEVYELNGIKPDIIVTEDTLKNELVKMLIENYIIYDFITHYIDTISKGNINILDDTNIYNNFVDYATDYTSAKYIQTISELDSIKTIDTNKRVIKIIENTIDSILLEYKSILLNDEYSKHTIKRYLDYDYKMRTLSESSFTKYVLTDDKNIKFALQLLNK